jgi:hypothetical protein
MPRFKKKYIPDYQWAIDSLKNHGYCSIYNPHDYEIEEIKKEFGEENLEIESYEPDFNDEIVYIKLSSFEDAWDDVQNE